MSMLNRSTASIAALLTSAWMHGLVGAAPEADRWALQADAAAQPGEPQTAGMTRPVPEAPSGPVRALASTGDLERSTMHRLLTAEAWPRRAIAALRMERYDCRESLAMLAALLRDRDWQVRCIAALVLARRGAAESPDPAWFAEEHHPRVLRTALRCRFTIEPERLARGARSLARSATLDDRLLAAELAAASGDPALMKLAVEEVRKVILRMDRIEAGSFSPRLAVLTGQRHLRRHTRWQDWLLREGRGLELRSGWLTPGIDPSGTPMTGPGAIARLDSEVFATLEGYMQTLSGRSVDLAICLDCTASMSGELAEAQGGIDDLMLFVGDVVEELRIAIVGYRDRRDVFETRAWDFTSILAEARGRLWQLSADGGGDGPESVYEALRLAYTQLAWNPQHTRVLVLVGDAPPHVGYGARCAAMAEDGARRELTTHIIQAGDEPVKHFPEIAAAGGGRCMTLAENASLIAEVTGLTLGDRFEEEFREFFALYLALCR
jgi:hypothetical protein